MESLSNNRNRYSGGSMSEKAGKTWAFRPRPKTAERLSYAEKLGIDRSALVNDVLEEHLRTHLEKSIRERKQELQSALAMPVP